MVSIGDTLTTPETGWKRYDNLNDNLIYEGDWQVTRSNSSYYNNSFHYRSTFYTYDSAGVIKFNFTGTKIRLIGSLQSGFDDSVSISIDRSGDVFSQHLSSGLRLQVVVYEKNNLNSGEHSVVISGQHLNLDAIDIDGELRPYDPKAMFKDKILLVSNNNKIITPLVADKDTSIFPVLSSDTPAVETSGYASGNNPYNIFRDDDTLHRWLSYSKRTQNQWVSYESNQRKKATMYSLSVTYNLNAAPKNWRIEGSEDGVNWLVMDVRKNVEDWELEVEKHFYMNRLTGTFKHYRIFVEENNGHRSYIVLYRWKMFDDTSLTIEAPYTKGEYADFDLQGNTLQQLSDLDFAEVMTEKHYINNTPTPLGSGKVFKQPLDEYKTIEKVSIR